MNVERDAHGPAARLEAFDLALEGLKEAGLGAPILVEGVRDVAALRALGVATEVLVMNVGETLVAVVERLHREGAREVILLADWDRTGGRLQRRLRELLEAHAIRVDDGHRLALLRACGNEARSVEDLPRVRERLVARLEEPRPKPPRDPDVPP